MPTLTIDNKTVTVPEGTNVLDAAKGVGIVIPHFCYHEALGAVGACRLCAMTFVEGPVKGMQMSCMVKAQDGMVVTTLDERSVDLRKHVIEWLMVNHPHDCPVCDEGGECQLQDMTVAGGHTIRRYRGLKRTYVNQDLGPFVHHEMNRCIQCYRCVRTYQDYCGGTDFGVLGCNQRIYFGRFRDGRLESPFSGNIVDACPTGVFTDKTFRFQARYWDLQEAPSVCPHCSLGCAVIPGARYRELQRVRGGVNRETNGFFICDRGRFGYGHANHPERPRLPRVGEHTVTWSEALETARTRLSEVVARHGAQAVAFLGSPRASLEANRQLLRLAQDLGSDHVVFDAHPGRDRAARTAAALLGEQARSQEEIRGSDCLIFVGADPLNEGPTMALAARQAVRQGASAAVVDPRPVELPFQAVHLPLQPERLIDLLKALPSGDFQAFSARERSILAGISARLSAAKNPVLIGGGDLLGGRGLRALSEAARSLTRPDRPCGTAVLLNGPNSYGGALLAGAREDFDRILNGVQEGRIKALVCLQADPFTEHPDPPRVHHVLSRLELMVTLDALPSLAARRADIFLPSTVPAEEAGTFVNHEGRMLPFSSVFDPGTPIRVTGEGDHPPRTFEAATPGSEPRPAWTVLAALRREHPSLAAVRREIETADPRFAGLTELDSEESGRRVHGGADLPHEVPLTRSLREPGESLCLLPTESLFGSEVLSALSPVLDPVRPAPELWLHVDDASRLGLAEGERVVIDSDFGRVGALLRVSMAMATGVAVLPRIRGTTLEVFVPGGPLRRCFVGREEAP